MVFGEKGSGKTAIRLQLARHLTDYNAEHPEHQVFVVAVRRFQRLLDRFRDRFSGRRRRADRALEQWRLWDHIDAILSLAVTQLVDRILENKQARHPAARDEAAAGRPARRRAGPRRDAAGGLLRPIDGREPVPALAPPAAEAAILHLAIEVGPGRGHCWSRWRWSAFFVWRGEWSWFGHWLPYVLIAAGWAPRGWRLLKWWWKAWRIARNTRVLNRNTKLLCRTLLNFPGGQIVGQPLPAWPRTDDRYELLAKLQGVLRSMHFDGILVLVDRVDEPYLINGSTDLMRALVWPMLDNKFLKHPGLGLKLLLPIELERLLDRESRDFHQRARLDKQNLIRSLALDRPIALRHGQRPDRRLRRRRAARRRSPICSRTSTSGG